MFARSLRTTILQRATSAFATAPTCSAGSPILYRCLQTSSKALASAEPTQATPPSSQQLPPASAPSNPTTAPPRAEQSPFPVVNTPPDASVSILLENLRLQTPHYLTIHINGVPFLVTLGDKVRLPFLLKDVKVGDTIRITHASVLGSREFTMKGNPWIDPQFFECRARVTEIASEAMRLKIKKKQRCRRTKTIRSKHKYTVLTISDLKVNGMKEAGAA